VIPDIVAVVIEDEVWVLRRGEPETMGELASFSVARQNACSWFIGAT
jgi:hypothetical protein